MSNKIEFIALIICVLCLSFSTKPAFAEGPLGFLFGDLSKKEFLHRITFDLEIDGRPYKFKRTIWCRLGHLDTVNGRVSYLYPDYYSFGYRIHDNSAAIILIPNMCARFKKSDPKQKTWEFSELDDDYLPTIYLADDALNPQKLDTYAEEWQYKSESSRINYKGITVTYVKKGGKFGFADRADRYSGYRVSR